MFGVLGRGWKASELRLKSWDDLQKLWYVLLKEKNMLMTQRQMLQAQNMMFPNPERIPKVLLLQIWPWLLICWQIDEWFYFMKIISRRMAVVSLEPSEKHILGYLLPLEDIIIIGEIQGCVNLS